MPRLTTALTAAPRILVDRADTLGGLAVVRSLGRAGFHVLAAAPDGNALGFASRFCGDRLLSPPWTSPNYTDWLANEIRRHKIALIIPSESMLLAIRDDFARFAPLLPCSRDANTVYAAFSKFDLFARTTIENRPPSLLVDFDAGDLPTLDAIRSLPLPCFVKLDGVHARLRLPSRVTPVHRHDEVLDVLVEAREQYTRALIQGFVPGRGAAAAIVRWNDRVIASMQYERIHEVPHTGGVSSLRGVISNPELARDAEGRATALGWNGPAMFEYRVDEGSGRFYLMELNARFWGSLHLALFAGVDFPAILARAVLGIEQSTNPVPRAVRSRITVPGELQYVASVVRDRSLPLGKRLGSIAGFIALGFSPGAHSDLLFGRDPAPYGRAISNYARVLRDRLRERSGSG